MGLVVICHRRFHRDPGLQDDSSSERGRGLCDARTACTGACMSIMSIAEFTAMKRIM